MQGLAVDDMISVGIEDCCRIEVSIGAVCLVEITFWHGAGQSGIYVFW